MQVAVKLYMTYVLPRMLTPRHEKQTKKIRPKRPETDIKIILLIQHPYVLYIS